MAPKLPAWITSALRGHTAADLLDGDDRVHQRAALAAGRLGHGDAEQALLGHQPRHVVGVVVAVGAFERGVRQVTLGEAAHRVAKLLLLLVEAEVHMSQSFWPFLTAQHNRHRCGAFVATRCEKGTEKGTCYFSAKSSMSPFLSGAAI